MNVANSRMRDAKSLSKLPDTHFATKPPNGENLCVGQLVRHLVFSKTVDLSGCNGVPSIL